MQSPRPPIIWFLIIFHFVGATCCLAGGMVQSTGFLERTVEKILQDDPKELQRMRETQRIVREEVRGYEVFRILEIGSSFLLSAMLLVCGMGLLRMQPWARWGSMAFAVLAIVYTLVATIYSLVCVVPVTNEINVKMVKALQEHDPAKAQELEVLNQMETGVQIIGGPCVSLIYPLAVLAILLSPPVKAAFFPLDTSSTDVTKQSKKQKP